MKALMVMRALGPIDLKNIRRDSLLRGLVLIIAVVTLLLRFGVPLLTAQLKRAFDFDVTPYYDLLASVIVQFFPLLFGVVIGFLLLDQRDDGTLTALQVTPLALEGYLAYRVIMPVLVSIGLTMVMMPLTGLIRLSWDQLLGVAIGAAPLAPLFALFLAAFAQNKVQGFALQKMSGIILAPPMLAYFVHSNWQLAFGLFPMYWSFKLVWMVQAGEPDAWVALVIGLVYQAVLIALLLRRFKLVMVR